MVAAQSTILYYLFFTEDWSQTLLENAVYGFYYEAKQKKT